jgi:integrase
VFAAFVRFLLLTSARRNEAAGMRWSEIAEGTWVLPAQRNKTGVELARPLSVAAREIIEGLPRLCDFVFSRNGQAAMGGIAELKYRLDQASGVSGWRLHDLRRTSRTVLSRAGVANEVGEKCLGHIVGGVAGIYNRHSYRDEMLLAYEKLSALIGQIVDRQPNVVLIRGQG